MDTIIKIFNDNIIINGVLYMVKSCIFHIDSNLFKIAIFNNEANLFYLKQNVNFYHDGLKNEGIIIELKDNFSNLIKDMFSYIIIINKLNNH